LLSRLRRPYRRRSTTTTCRQTFQSVFLLPRQDKRSSFELTKILAQGRSFLAKASPYAATPHDPRCYRRGTTTDLRTVSAPRRMVLHARPRRNLLASPRGARGARRARTARVLVLDGDGNSC